jgi:DNA-binding MltR family transcriptional regulator
MSFLALFRKNRVSNTLVASVFEGKGPLATFSAKVDVCIGLGTIPDYRHDLKIINTVRNKFAHSATELHLKDFDNCRTLKASAPIQVEEGECLKRQKFKQACAAIISHICNASLVNIAEDRFVAANPEGVRKEYEVMLKEAYSAEAPTE